MRTSKMLTGWTLAAALGLMMVASPALAKSKKDTCHRSCAARNTIGEECQRGCPPAEGSTSGDFKKCSKACLEKSEEWLKKCEKSCKAGKQ